MRGGFPPRPPGHRAGAIEPALLEPRLPGGLKRPGISPGAAWPLLLGAAACSLLLLAGLAWAQVRRPPAAPAPRPAPPVLGPRQLPGYGLLRVVRVARDGLIPKELQVPPGATVVWFNTTTGFASVTFSEGRKLAEASRSATLFYLAPDGTFTSGAFGPGGVASVTLLEAGKYAFFVTGLDALEGAAFGTVEVVP